jgi:hypothetical protein
MIQMKIEVNEFQYSLIMNALEKYYYSCKNDHQMIDEIHNLEVSLIKQALH